MAYSKAKLKSNGDRASPCFKPFLIGNMSDKFLPTRTLLYVSVRHIFTSLTSFLGIPNSRRILYLPNYTVLYPRTLTENSGFSVNRTTPNQLQGHELWRGVWIQKDTLKYWSLQRRNPTKVKVKTMRLLRLRIEYKAVKKFRALTKPENLLSFFQDLVIGLFPYPGKSNSRSLPFQSYTHHS